MWIIGSSGESLHHPSYEYLHWNAVFTGNTVEKVGKPTK